MRLEADEDADSVLLQCHQSGLWRSLALSCHGGKINSAILPVPVSLAVIEIENQMSGEQIIALSISSCPPSAGQWCMITERWIWRGRNVKLNSSALVYQTWQLGVTDSRYTAGRRSCSRLLRLLLKHLNLMKGCCRQRCHRTDTTWMYSCSNMSYSCTVMW